MMVFMAMNMEELWNSFSGENHIDYLGLHCTWFTGEPLN